MKKLTQHEFIEHLKTLTSRSFFEVAGETWSHNEKDQTWVLNEPLMWFCPICTRETRVSVLDNSAKLDGILICHPESLCINIDYAGADIEPHNHTYRCAECETPLSLQSTADFEEELRAKGA